MTLGDDMGANLFTYVGARLDMLNLPYLRDINARFFSQAEFIYYPAHERSLSIKENTRLAFGFGLSVPLTPMFNFAIYYNAVNINSRVGDIERSSLINFTFNFF